MGRTQSFDTAEAVTAARNVFWNKGFEGTSLPDLERATGLSRSSLYHAFDSKRGLFDAAVQNYLDTVIRPRLRPLTAEPISPDALANYLTGLSQAITAPSNDSARNGCLLLNSAAGMASHDEAMRAVVEAYRAELGAAFERGLIAASAHGSHSDLTPDQVVTTARVLTSLTISAFLIARINPQEAANILEAALSQLPTSG
ncbi:TetR/AcrR family transcriptional regulator [Lysinibacter cavernae]|uniref:AcrR family transcriptional regulator n=1 Tax=Lysinibacter cavernae TaxID=1640652 RepID=A0A7X5R1P1_9MICO|nr:TetR/AcrR family transcriptional regulator [Lysinibacter cavernae]NIH53735.1 AcrR family transcriptional regulator [Lysinibacter cavernae]